MSDYIKREDAKKAACELCDWYGFCGNGCEYRNPIDDVPAADVVERKSGEWLETWHEFFKRELPVCSYCGSFTAYRTNYCPNCGADMRGGDAL